MMAIPRARMRGSAGSQSRRVSPLEVIPEVGGVGVHCSGDAGRILLAVAGEPGGVNLGRAEREGAHGFP
jgi:hypothetical protein